MCRFHSPRSDYKTATYANPPYLISQLCIVSPCECGLIRPSWGRCMVNSSYKTLGRVRKQAFDRIQMICQCSNRSQHCLGTHLCSIIIILVIKGARSQADILNPDASPKKKVNKNIQQRGFASGHPPNY
jgi:hypothetical protein